jgi:KUP system potassium uptake protein
MTDSVSAPVGSELPVNGSADARSSAGFWRLTLGSIGVVYGDIGTSPLYALREAVVAASGVAHEDLTRASALGVVSLILWALVEVVTLKYVLILLRADNNGEGGTLTLMALASRAVGRIGKAAGVVALLGHHQRGAVLRRRHDHAGAIGAVRCRRHRRGKRRRSTTTWCPLPSSPHVPRLDTDHR